MGQHESFYQNNEAYAEFLAGWNPAFYGKYTNALRPDRKEGRALDVGCGVGQVVAALTRDGVAAHGVDVSGPNVARARGFSERCQLYDGRRLPFPDRHFARVGALNVLEHVDEPEAFLAELVRVTEPGGKVIVSSPNFLRVIGLRDYHYRMRGLGNKWQNLQRLLAKRRQMQEAPDQVRFERVAPVVKTPFEPDDDAIIMTNALEMAFQLERLDCVVEQTLCTDRNVFAPLDWLLNLTPLRYGMLCAFVVAKRKD